LNSLFGTNLFFLSVLCDCSHLIHPYAGYTGTQTNYYKFSPITDTQILVGSYFPLILLNIHRIKNV